MMDMVSFPPYVNPTFRCESACSLVVMRGTRNNQAAVCRGKFKHQPAALLSFLQVSSPISLGVMYVKL